MRILCLLATALFTMVAVPVPAGPLDGDNRRLILVDVSLDIPSVIAPQFVDSRHRIEKSLAIHAADDCHGFARYFRWGTWDGKAIPAPAAKLTLKFAEVADLDWPRIELAFSAERDGKPMSIEGLAPIVLYQVTDPLPTGSEDRVSHELQSKVSTLLNDGSLRKALCENFLQLVSMCDELFASQGEKRVVVPFRPTLLAARRNSVFRARLISDIGKGPREGSLLLKHDAPFMGEEKELMGLTQCQVAEFTFPPEETVRQWDQRIPAVLSKKSLLQLFMVDYHFEPNPESEGTLSTTPGGK